jgi:hypothetical protein
LIEIIRRFRGIALAGHLDDPIDQPVIAIAGLPGCIHEGGRGIEAGHGIDLQDMGLIVLVQSEINPGEVIYIQDIECLDGDFLNVGRGL